MKAITLWQPWASLITEGLKKYETRGWATTYRGPIAIHAAKRPINWDEINFRYISELAGIHLNKKDFEVYGAVVAIAQLTECYEMTLLPAKEMKGGKQISLNTTVNNNLTRLEMRVGLWDEHRFAWKLEDVRAIEPVFMNGRQGLWSCELDLEVPV